MTVRASEILVGLGVAMHHALGFQETERVVFFRKPLPPDARSR